MLFQNPFRLKITSILVLAGLLIASCGEDKPKSTPGTAPTPPPPPPPFEAIAPEFNADSAYAFIEKQVAFGPRVPNTESWAKCADYLENQLKAYDFEVTVQEGKVTTYNGLELDMRNIIGRFNPEIKNRILLFAHWDTRPYADKDSQRQNVPIDGANDGGSGVGVILEIARVLKTVEKKPTVGLDVIFFDVEDYGQPVGTTFKDKPETYCLGSQYWAANPPIPDFNPKYGILLDMVGAANAKFTYEGISLRFAGELMGKVWRIGNKLGYGDYFLAQNMGFEVQDDHLYVNQIANIPSIDIIEFHPPTRSFGPYHHTHKDNMDVIDKSTLKAVGQTLLEVLFRES